MHQFSRRLIGMLLAVLLLTSLFSVCSFSADEVEKPPYITHGTCGDPTKTDVEYYVFDDGSIAFFKTGTSGVIKDYEPEGGMPSAPWYDLTVQTTAATFQSTKIAFESGITTIGAYDFYLPSSLTGMLKPMLRTGSIEFPDSLTTIGAHAFENQMKLEKLTFPQNLTTIGEDAFKGCTALYGIDYYGDPSRLTWNVGTAFSQLVTVHIKPAYESQLDSLNRTYQQYNITFVANLHSTIEGDGIERNINISMGQENSGVFGGAAPFVIVGTFFGQKKSVTYGSNGFATAIKVGDQYYLLENNSSKNLYAPVIKTGGYVDTLDKTQQSPLQLELSHEYIGKNIVKVKYKLTNSGSTTISNFKLGSTGDIKIGADDYAAIHPLKENGTQIGFYMTSTKDYDTDDNGNAATLGFIAKNVAGSSANATYYFGPVAANSTGSATGAYRHRLFPERIFSQGTGATSVELTQTTDSGVSYYWDIDKIDAGESKEYAVLFSVYGSNTTAATENQGQEMVTEKEKTYHTVTWDYNFDGDYNAATNSGDSYKMLVEHIDGTKIPFYPAETPQKPRTVEAEFTFKKWVTGQNGTEVTSTTMPQCSGGDATFYAEYEQHNEVFFKKHSLTLQGDIGIYFYVNVAAAGLTPSQIQDGSHSISFSFSWKTTPAPYSDLTQYNITLNAANYSSLYDTSEGMFKIKCDTAVAEMSCIVHASAIVTNTTNNNVVYTDSDDYSVREYALTIIDDPSTYGSNLVNLAKAMLDYGAKAQTVFGIATGSPANEGVDYTMADVTPETIDNAVKSANPLVNEGNGQSVMTENTDAFGCDYAGATVVFLTKTTLRLYYTVNNQGLYDTYKNTTVNFTNNEEKAPYMMFELSNIAASQLDTLQTLTIAGQTYHYSVLDYSKNVLNNPKANTANKNLAKATYWYNYFANLYFGN